MQSDRKREQARLRQTALRVRRKAGGLMKLEIWIPVSEAGDAQHWVEMRHPGGRIHGGERSLSWEMQALLVEAYRAGQQDPL